MKKTSIFTLFLCIFLLLSGISAFAVTDTITKSGTFSYSNGSGTWTLYSDGELVISGTGYMWPSKTATVSSYPWYSYRSSVKKVTVEKGITFIGYQAFYGYSNLTSVSLPGGFIQIGNETFRNCDKLTSIKLPDTVTNIGEFAFYDCDTLTSVQMPNKMYTIYKNAFGSCNQLKDIVITASTVQQEAFRYCEKLSNVTVATTSLSVYQNAFANCSSLTNVNFTGTETQWNNIKKSATSYTGNDKFWNANLNYVSQLTFGANNGDISIAPVFAVAGSTVTIPNDTPARAGYTFYGWGTYKYDKFVTYYPGDVYTLAANSTLYAVWETPEGVIAKGTHPSTDMSWILYDDGHLVISGTGSVYGDNSSDTEGYKHYRTKIKKVTINEGIVDIAHKAFSNFPITEISLPSTIGWIGNNAFSYTSLKTITLPSSITTLGNGIFLGSSIETINLGNPSHNISAIFTNCTDMTRLDCITVDENNALYTTVDGVLYNKDMTILIRVPATRSGQFVVPDTVIGISKYAFSDTANLESLVLPVSLASIGDRVFNSGESPIIYYKGTEAQWQNVTIGTVWNNIVPTEYEYGKTYSITFDAKGGTGAPAADEKMKGFSYTLPEVIPQKAGYAFLGWATDAKANVAQYQSGDAYTEDCDTVFYAVWELIEATVEYNPASRWWMFNVSVEGNPDGKSAYVAIYDQYDNYLSCDSFPIVNGASELMIAKDSLAKTAKVFVLDDSSVAPYTKSVTIPLN